MQRLCRNITPPLNGTQGFLDTPLAIASPAQGKSRRGGRGMGGSPPTGAVPRSPVTQRHPPQSTLRWQISQIAQGTLTTPSRHAQSLLQHFFVQVWKNIAVSSHESPGASSEERLSVVFTDMSYWSFIIQSITLFYDKLNYRLLPLAWWIPCKFLQT